jgi:phosphatidate cytidylyltransferase
MKRIITGIVLVAAVVGLVLWGHPYLLAGIAAAVAELGLWEFFRLAEKSGGKVARAPGYFFAASIVLSGIARSPSVCILGALVLCLMLVASSAMFSGRELSGFLREVSSALFGVVYVAAPLSLLVWVCLRPGGRALALFALVLVWTGDTMAFFVGSNWGKHKLAPRISPGKTWEGTIASFGSAIGVGLLYVRFFSSGIGYGEAALLSATVNVAAQAGDLAESALKRGAGVKDSSNLVPGHGGVLDRIDALLFAAPVLWYYWWWKTV